MVPEKKEGTVREGEGGFGCNSKRIINGTERAKRGRKGQRGAFEDLPRRHQQMRVCERLVLLLETGRGFLGVSVWTLWPAARETLISLIRYID